MAYNDFLIEFAKAQKVGSLEELLTHYAKRYSFQINSRERAKQTIAMLQEKLGLDWQGKRVLDVGCAYAAFTIELAKLGAKVVGIDINKKWLDLGKTNAINEVDVPLLLCDASSRKAIEQLHEYGPFDVVLVNDVLEHIYDTAGLLFNLTKLMRTGGILFFKVPNGQATRHVLLEGHKRVFGISLLPPDYWSSFVDVPFHIYYRRWEYFTAQFNQFGFHDLKVLNSNTDPSLESTQKHINADIKKIRKHLKPENFKNATQFQFVKKACGQYFDEVNEDLQNMAWEQLYFKYRVTFWEGLIYAP